MDTEKPQMGKGLKNICYVDFGRDPRSYFPNFYYSSPPPLHDELGSLNDPVFNT